MRTGEIGDLAGDPCSLRLRNLGSGEGEEPVRSDRVPAQRMALDEAAAIDEPARGGEDPTRVRLAALGLEATPVERQRGKVEELQPLLIEPLGGLLRLALQLSVGELDRLEPGASEPERVVPLSDDNLMACERAAVLSADGQLDVCRAVLPDCRFGACHGQRLHGASTEKRAGMSSDRFVSAALLCLQRGG